MGVFSGLATAGEAYSRNYVDRPGQFVVKVVSLKSAVSEKPGNEGNPYLAGTFEIKLDPSGLLATKWLRLNFESTDGNWDGVQLLAANATFNPNVGGFSSWTFAGQPAFINGTAYKLDWQNF